MGPVHLLRPTQSLVAGIAQRASETPFTYDLQGGTRGTLPEGWDHDQAWVVLGTGQEVWDQAVAALQCWTQFDLDWVTPHDRTVPLEPGRTFAFTSHQLGVYVVNVCRVVYVTGAPEDSTFGFAYGTVGSHAVRGEERFELRRDDAGEVSFGITKFSQPAHAAMRVLGPITRRIQRRFTENALERMKQELA